MITYEEIIIEQIGRVRTFRGQNGQNYITSIETLTILLPSKSREKIKKLLPERTNEGVICMTDYDKVFETILDEIRNCYGIGG